MQSSEPMVNPTEVDPTEVDHSHHIEVAGVTTATAPMVALVGPIPKRARRESEASSTTPAKVAKPARVAKPSTSTIPSTSKIPDPAAKTTPFNFRLFSKASNETFSSRGRPDRHSIDVKLSIPAPEDECPLTLDSISESRLQCLPDTPFLLDRPLHSKLTLPCGHSFSAMTLIYSFCKNSMTCPCCRAGKDVRVDTQCLPTHFRAQIKSHIQQTLETEHRQDESREFLDAVESFSMFGVSIPYEVLSRNGNLTLVANFYDMPATRITETARPIFAFTTEVRATTDNGRMTLAPVGTLRSLNNIMSVGVNAIQMSMQLAMQGVENILIDSTPIIRLSGNANNANNTNNTNNTNNANNSNNNNNVNNNASRRLTIPGSSSNHVTHNSMFQVLVQLQNEDEDNPISSFSVSFDGVSINSLSWSPGTESLEILSSNIQLAAIL